MGLCYFYRQIEMRKRIQMKSPVHMTWRLEEELYERIVEAAEHAGMSVSAFVRNLVKKEVEKEADEGVERAKTHP